MPGQLKYNWRHGFIADTRKILFQVAASMQKDVDAHIPNYPNLPSKLICLLHNVTLHVCFWFFIFLFVTYKWTGLLQPPFAFLHDVGYFIGWCWDGWSLCSDDSPASQLCECYDIFLFCFVLIICWSVQNFFFFPCWSFKILP